LTNTEIYRIHHILDETQTLADGFEDSEIVVNARTDQSLDAIVGKVRELGGIALTKRGKITLLALYVSNRFGGCQPTPPTKDMLGIESLSRLELGNVLAGKERAIGTITHGGSRHRALLFKYLCDMEGIGIPCRLYRGTKQKHHRHEAWVTVQLDGGDDNGHGKGDVENNWYVVDLVHDPCQVYQEGSAKANSYLTYKKKEEPLMVLEESGGPLPIPMAGANRSLPAVDFQGGDIIIQKQLGEGGFGKVYQCSIHGYTCAVKRMIRTEEITEDDRRELENLRTLQHDHIIRFLGFQHHTSGYEHVLDIFTELADGTLDDYLLTRRKTAQWKEVATKKSPLTFSHFKRLVEQILSALSYLHSVGKMHRKFAM